VAGSLTPDSIVSFAPVGPYVNASVDAAALAGEGLDEIIGAGVRFGELPFTGKRVLVEHTSSNPTGPLHVGRARNPVIGDTLARLLRKAGNTVETEFFVNDIGKQLVALAWGVAHLNEDEFEGLPARLAALGASPEEVKSLEGLAAAVTHPGKVDHELVRFYQAASALSRFDPDVAAAIAEDVRKIETGDEEAMERVRTPCNRVLDGIKASLARLGADFDRFTFESDFIVSGSVADVVARLKELPQSQEEDGAYLIDLEPYGITGRTARFVFVRADGTTLYATRDVAYHLDKATRCDRGLNILGEDQKLASKQVEAALDLLGSVWRPEPVFYAFVSLPEGKMSTRQGRVVSLDDLLDEAVKRARAEVDRRREDLDEEAKARISEAVGVGAVRFNIIRVQPEKGITFRWEEAMNFEGYSAPSVQYAHARACSILRKAGRGELVGQPERAAVGLGDRRWIVEDGPSTRLLRALARLPLVVEECAESLRPHNLAAYAQEVASVFNEFYRDTPVRESGEAEPSRIGLVAAARSTLGSTLDLLGVAALTEM
jgi:arginyl-tRNA synthetase